LSLAAAAPRPPQGIVLWRGPSAIDGQPIVVIATGLRRKAQNPKTGAMIQTWILREDVSPVAAIYSGADVSVCGNCPLRGNCGRGRACYVNVYRAPQAIWKAHQRDAYVNYSPREHNRFFRSDPRKAYVAIRLGAYGDPAAAPYALWSRLCRLAKRWTGYTHQWSVAVHKGGKTYRPFDAFKRLCMASVESAGMAKLAQERGWRTFRSRTAAEPLLERESSCPAAKESGAKTQCMLCRACTGTMFGTQEGFRNMSILAHGGPAVTANYNRLNGNGGVS
jgi:hypothetical protein